MIPVGIDLGTTYSAIAHLDDRGRAAVLPNREGDLLTASAVFLDGAGNAVVGSPAADLKLERPDAVATHIKRRMGYPDFGSTISGRTFRPETLSAVILKKLLDDAAEHIGPIRRAVITVPAYFDETRRRATIDAGRIAGLERVDLFEEPCAAALTYLLNRKDDAPQTAVVYDLGGGTFDVTVVKLGGKRIRTLAIEGDVQLGGKDWDDALVNEVAERFQAQAGSDPRTDPQSLALLQASAERAKRTLTKIDSANATCSHSGHRLTVPVTRTEFERLTSFLLERTRLTTQAAVAMAGLTWNDIDRVLMVGGSTHMPMAARMLRELTGKQPERSPAVSELVARGAALHAGILAAKEPNAPATALSDIEEVRVSAHSLGVEVRDGERRTSDILIPKHTQLPARAARTYRTAKPGQNRVRVRVLQGEARQAESCIPVGDCWIEGLPAGSPGGAAVEVTFDMDEAGSVHVSATAAGRQAHADLRRPTGLTEAEIGIEREWVAKLKVQ